MKKLGGIICTILIGTTFAIADIDIYQDTTINSDLGDIVRVHDSAKLTVLSGSAVSIDLLDTSTANVYGGNISYTLDSSSILNLYGGYTVPNTSGIMCFDNLAKIYIYGQNFQMVPASDNHISVFLNGNWLDGTSFHIYLRYLPQPYEQALGTNILLVPEPTTVSLLIIGILGVRKFKHQKKSNSTQLI